MTSSTYLKKIFPCLLLLVVIVICQYYVVVTNGTFTSYLRRKLSDSPFTKSSREPYVENPRFSSLTPIDTVSQAFAIPFKLPEESNKIATGTLHVLLLSYARTGSSFVGDLLQSYPKAFYHFEPLHFLSSSVVSSIYPEARQLLNKLFNCQVSQLPGFLTWKKSHKNFMKLKRNVRFWKTCTLRQSCYNASFIDSYCASHNVIIIKTIRLGLEEASLLFTEYPELNLKIIYLARDPRGTMNSRMQIPVRDWCKKDPMCFNPRKFCSGLKNDSEVACQLLTTRPNDFTIVRYEDLSRQPFATAKKISKFLGLTDTASMEAFLASHTATTVPVHKAVDGIDFPYSTFRNSVMTSTKWRQDMPFVRAVRIQNDCIKVLEWLGYHKYTTSGALKSNVNFDKDLYESLVSYCPQEINIS